MGRTQTTRSHGSAVSAESLAAIDAAISELTRLAREDLTAEFRRKRALHEADEFRPFLEWKEARRRLQYHEPVAEAAEQSHEAHVLAPQELLGLVCTEPNDCVLALIPCGAVSKIAAGSVASHGGA